jgi:dTDP-4-amino-4,6-dideoxygalactose transaminase
VSDFACYRSVATKDPLSVARRVAESILTLPIYNELTCDEVHAICDIIRHLHATPGRGPA